MTRTRKMLVAMVAVLALGAMAAATPAMAHDEASEWARPGWEAGIKSGTVRGYPDGTYRPLNDASREEAHAFAWREAEAALEKAYRHADEGDDVTLRMAKHYTDDRIAAVNDGDRVPSKVRRGHMTPLEIVLVTLFGAAILAAVITIIVVMGSENRTMSQIVRQTGGTSGRPLAEIRSPNGWRVKPAWRPGATNARFTALETEVGRHSRQINGLKRLGLNHASRLQNGGH